MCDHNENIISGIIIGSVGGFFAGIAIWIVGLLRESWLKSRDKRRIYKWLLANTEKGSMNKEWRSAKTIASYTDLPIDRTIYICSIHEKIAQNTGDKENLFTLKTIAER